MDADARATEGGLTMAKEYMEREAVIKHLDNLYDKMNALSPQFYSGFMLARHQVNDFPAADVMEVRHGRWIDAPLVVHGAPEYICDQCQDDDYWKEHNQHYKDNFCPNCGVIMDKEREKA